MADLGYETFKSKWIDHVDIRNEVRDLLKGEVLNFPCGQSPLGDTQADVDPSTNPDIIADVKNAPFEPNSFDTVYCDPPYSFFTPGQRMSWVQPLYKIARQRLIVQGPNTALHVGAPSEQQLLCLKPVPGSSKRGIRVLQVFDHPDSSLKEF